MKVFVDTNVFLDILFKREDFYADALKVWKILDFSEYFQGYISSSILTDIYYIAQKQLGNNKVKEFLLNMLDVFELLNISSAIARNAILSDFKDFEDAVQNFCAEKAGCKILITRNKMDFTLSSLKILTPNEFICEIDNNSR